MIEVNGVHKAYGKKRILNDISFRVDKGEFFGIIGPNGSGKSTLLKLVSALEPANAGEIKLDGRRAQQYTRKELARWMAVLQQDALPPIGFKVREVVEMGRYPFQNWLGDEKDDSEEVINKIMDRLNLNSLAELPLELLSGGERQRVALGKTMAQQPRLLLLDEPTTFLDIGYQMQMMDYVKTWQAEERLTVVAVLHDLNLAAQYCDRILVLHEGRTVCVGAPNDMMTSELISDVYGTTPIVIHHPESGIPQILLNPQFTEGRSS
ncbi:ABC transporter ATP-binding protein [Paenibacillus sp. J2TS4]|uniref:ABC transporter ATP-binding protein n=1 Tax=Paenibacillus sp. J2TS4 TaxID=2807194 RepID=UPI001B0A50E6|nr:ABC transporter ATP-binding protein [Paenibacillus sp. J2TS4]GIP34368.1 ABC transporter ATP-binding protein [Paenibacillus sp. J2TS4]